MNHEKIVPQAFMLLPREIREHLAKVFEIGKSGPSEVRDDQVISDGRTQEDLLAITPGKMADYVGSEESFGRLWDLTIAKARYELNPPVDIATIIGALTGAPVEDEKKIITAGDGITEKTNAKGTKKNK